MIHKLKGVLFFVLLCSFTYAQNDKKIVADTSKAAPSNKTSFAVDSDSTDTPASNELVITPTVGLGTGMLSFYGDIYTKHFQPPMVSRMAYELTVSQKIQDYLAFNFYAMFGKLGADERYTASNRNLNFESQIRAGGINLEYNFDNFLPKDRTASPYISLGFESFEFLSKTDLKDANGNTYYYWSDGTIRNKDQGASDANLAVIIKRDYKYESDIREMNLDGFGKYAERSFAIPVGVGAIFKLNDFFDFKFGTAMHFTFTDYIDGVTDKSKGNRIGNSKNDNFMMTSFSLRYNFGTKHLRSKKKAEELKLKETYENVDFAAIDAMDQDNDGVPDDRDLCQGTPPGVPVDADGCPLDDDKDGVPNYKDDELKSRKNAVVNARGVELTDSVLAYQSRMYNDTSGEFGLVEERDPEEIRLGQREYTVELGSYKKGLPPNLMTKFLSISDISSAPTSDSATIYTAGKFDNLHDAEKRKRELIKDGLTDAKVVYKQNSKYHNLSEDYASNTSSENKKTNKNDKVQQADLSGKFLAPDKTPLANSKVNVVNEKGNVIQTTETDKFGSFRFTYLPADQNVLFGLDEKDPQLKKLKKIYLTNDKGENIKEVYPKNSPFNYAVYANTIASANNPALVGNDSKQKKADLKGKFISADKTPLANSKVNLINEKGEVLQTTQTDKFGSFRFSYLPADQNVLFALDETDPQLKKLKKIFLADSKGENIKEVYPKSNPFNYASYTNASNNTTDVAVNNNKHTANTSSNSALNVEGVVLRVQLGAYKKRLSKAVFKDIDDLIEIKTDDGLYKYMTGSYTNMDAAAKHKVDMSLKGYSGAFITAYKNGNRITLEEAGATIDKKEDNSETKENATVNTVDKKLVKFKVQVGVFKNQPPKSKLEIFIKLGTLDQERTKSGLTRYVVGSFSTSEEAEVYKATIIKTYGLTDAFVVALFNDEYISMQEAREILK